ncbi:hypothetical protein L4C42_05005 [Vibrio wakamikoensis]|uniref:Uncharacterized protein n=1 Tax=Vibrio chaetopteri TaxID=3016528 RepID=A0AAU8BNC4_9VIBR
MDCSSLAITMDINGSKLVLAWGPNQTTAQCIKDYHNIQADLSAQSYMLSVNDHKNASLEKPISAEKASSLMDQWQAIQNGIDQDLDVHW